MRQLYSLFDYGADIEVSVGALLKNFSDLYCCILLIDYLLNYRIQPSG